MLSNLFRSLILVLVFAAWVDEATLARAQDSKTRSPAELRAEFRKLLDRPRIALDPQPKGPPRTLGGHVEERLSIATERKASGDIERVPMLIVRPEKATGRLPVVIVLHGTGGNKDSQRSWLVDLSNRGIIGVAIDARYHGERAGGAKGSDAYVAAIIRAWRAKPGEHQEHPFFYDTAYDLWRVIDYLTERSDVDPDRIGMIGISMGGIQTWLSAAVDERVKVAVPAIAVQSFRWSLENEQWQGRARTIQQAHEVAAKDLGERQVNSRVCRELWNKVIPGMLDQFDCPNMLPLFAGRSLLIIGGENDPNCPLGGAKIAVTAAEKAFQANGSADHLQIDIARGVAHQVPAKHHDMALQWVTKWLKKP